MRKAVLFEIFMDIQKYYYSLHWERALEIIAAYGVGPRTVRILWTYWDRLTMVAIPAGTSDALSMGYQGFTQGDPLSPTIFNVVMYTGIRHWVAVVTPTEAGRGGIGLTIIDLAACLYDDDGLVAST